MMRAILAASVLALASCASVQAPGSSNAETSVYALKSGYAVALRVAVAYRRLPVCSQPPVLPCHDPAILAQLRRADTVTSAALDMAEAAVRNPSLSGAARERAVTAARAALEALTSITGALRLEALR